MARAMPTMTDLRRMSGVPTKYLIRCETCGHQAAVSVLVQGGRQPAFVCSYCGDREPCVDIVRR
jgi:transcription elongation factor Elf1